jgi:hypothetical protein
MRPWLFRSKILLNKHDVHRYTDFERIAFVRNPWDRLVSCYADKILRDKTHEAMAESIEQYDYYENYMPFADFARAVSRIPDKKANRHFRSQHTFLTDRSGDLMPNRIGYFETLSEDFARMCREHDMPNLELPRFKVTRRTDYRDYYDAETIDLVRERYKTDIELFGYKF